MSIATARAHVATALTLLSVSTFAAESRTADEVVVTAARIEQPLSRVIGGATVITREDIERRQARSIHELLRGETGLSVVNTGGLGKLTNVYMRGADAEQILVLIDGVRAGSATSGTMAFEYLPVEQIERIEIVRGPRSSIYGADAIGGVIQIFTRREQGASMSVGAGSDDTFDVSGGFGVRGERTWLSVAANHLRSDGFNACNGAPFPPGGGCFTIEPDRDGFDSSSAALRAGGEVGPFTLDGSVLYAEGENEYDGSFANRTDFVNRAATLSGRVRPNEQWSVRLTLGETRDLQDNLYDDPQDDSPRLKTGAFDTIKRSASLQSDWSLDERSVVSFGVDYVDDIVASSTAYEATSRDNVGLFAQYQRELGAHQALLSARRDDNEQFGGYTSGSLGWRWAVNEQFAVNAALGTAFGAPTFNDLYYPGFSNPNLDPEESRSFEVGLSGREAQLKWSLAAFQNEIDEQIVYDAAIFAPNNLNEARIRGVEAEASAGLGAWTVGASFTYLDARNRSPGFAYGNYLPRRARQIGHVEVGRAFGALDARARLTAEGPRYDDVANTYRLGGYAVLDLLFDYTIGSHWTLQAKVANLFDRDYEVVRYYNQDDRSFFVNVQFRP